MTEFEIELATELAQCSMLTGSSMKRFCRDMAFKAKNDPGAEISLRQRHYLEVLAWRFRRQLARRLVPDNKPLDLPDTRKVSKKASSVYKSGKSVDETAEPLVIRDLFA